jgi:tight adherence protein B
MPALDALLRRVNLSRHLELLLYQAGVNTRVGVLVLGCAALGAGVYLLGLLLFRSSLVGLALGTLFGALPYAYVRYRKSTRMRAFAEELPDALDLLVSAMRAGLSFSAAMQIVAEESPEPVRSEFAVTVEEQTLGRDFRECLLNLCRRIDSLDLRFFATAVILQRESGGNLAEILAKTSDLIRDRFRILGDVQTFTAQGRITGVILMCLPVAMGVFTYLVAPEYMRPMLDSEAGHRALVLAGGLQVLGMLIIHKIVQIRV